MDLISLHKSLFIGLSPPEILCHQRRDTARMRWCFVFLVWGSSVAINGMVVFNAPKTLKYSGRTSLSTKLEDAIRHPNLRPRSETMLGDLARRSNSEVRSEIRSLGDLSQKGRRSWEERKWYEMSQGIPLHCMFYCSGGITSQYAHTNLQIERKGYLT